MGLLNYSFRELQDHLILWCYENHKKYPTLFAMAASTVTLSTNIGLYHLFRHCYRLTTFAGKYGTQRTRRILQIGQSSGLYKRYSGNQEKHKSWALVCGRADGINYHIAKMLVVQGFNIVIASTEDKETID